MQLDKLSPALRSTFLAASVAAPARPIRVIVMTRQSPQATVSRATRTVSARNDALGALESAGVSSDIFHEYAISPRHVYALLQTSSDAQPGRVLEQAPFRGGAAVDATPETIDLLSEQDAVEAIVEDHEHRVHLDVAVPMIGVDAAFSGDITGKGVVVAIIDSGIDVNHPAFAGRISDASTNFSDEGTADDFTDRNGHGTHVAGIVGAQAAGDEPYRGVAPDVTLMVLKVFNSRGRARASDIAAAVSYATSNGAHVINYSGGYAPWRPPLLTVTPPWVWSARETFEELSFNAAPAQGVVAVVSAGNEGTLNPSRSTISTPGIAEHVLTVGSVEKALAGETSPLSIFSSQGVVLRSSDVSLGDVVTKAGFSGPIVEMAKPDVVAPGGNYDQSEANLGLCAYTKGIISALAADAGQSALTCRAGTSQYTRWSGTSMSAPMVTGLVALVLELARKKGIDLQTKPTRAFIIKNLIMKNAVDLSLANEEQGWGLASWAPVAQAVEDIARGNDRLENYAPV